MASGETQMAKPKVARMGERMASRASRRIMKCSTCDARLAIPNASGRTRNRVLLPIRCNRRNCTERCQPSLQSRGPHLPPPDCQPARCSAGWSIATTAGRIAVVLKSPSIVGTRVLLCHRGFQGACGTHSDDT